ncbi:hypothetical protein HDR63_02125 [bacterium]|nr:hypothetical protein [bacterium]
MKIYTPRNFKEVLIASLPNCTTMVLGMMTLNLWIYGALTWGNFWAALPKIYLTAFVLDFCLVGPIVMRFVRRYHIEKFMPLFRVGLMAGILTFLAPLVEAGFLIGWRWYLCAFPRNYIVALLLQVLVAFRLGQYALMRYQSKHDAA